MKIVVINGQNHKGSTWKIGNILADKLSGDQEIREYFLPRDLNHFCCGCYSCLEARERCPYWSEKAPFFEDMLAADLLIFTSPTYCMLSPHFLCQREFHVILFSHPTHVQDGIAHPT